MDIFIDTTVMSNPKICLTDCLFVSFLISPRVCLLAGGPMEVIDCKFLKFIYFVLAFRCTTVVIKQELIQTNITR